MTSFFITSAKVALHILAAVMLPTQGPSQARYQPPRRKTCSPELDAHTRKDIVI